MAEASITQIDLVNNPAAFTDPIIMDVQYECLSALKDDLEWQLIYVGSANSSEHDQVLDSALVGPVFAGKYKFRMEAPAPDPSKVPVADLVGVTALLLTCSYKGKEFVRVGYYVNNEYTDPELAGENAPAMPQIDKLQRNIMADYPRVTKFPHDFDNDPQPMPEAEPEPEPEDMQDMQEEDEEEDEDSAGEQENMAPQDNTAVGGAQQAGDMDLDKPVQMSQ
jgi:histone chaperone ASF1